MNFYKKTSFFFFLLIGSSLFAEKYVDSNEIKELLNKIEGASALSGQNQDMIQKELNELERKTNLANQKRNLESSENTIGATDENVLKRVDALEKFYSTTSTVEDFIYSDNFSYQLICKGTVNCKATALVESEIFNQKIQLVSEKISQDKASIVKGLKNIYPMDDKLTLIRQIEQTTYAVNQSNMSLGNSYNNTQVNDNKKKKYIEIKDGDILGNIKITVTQNYVKLSKK